MSLCVNPLATALGFMAGGLFLQGGIAASIADAYAVSITPGLGFIASGPIRGINAGSGLALRWHPGGTAPVGLFFAPSVEVNYYALKEKGSGANSGALGTGIGGLVGYQWIRRSRFTIALTGGIQYLIPRRFEVGDSQYKLLPVMPRLVLDLGYTFGRVPARTVRYSAPQADQDGRQLKAECRVPAADCRAPSAKWSER